MNCEIKKPSVGTSVSPTDALRAVCSILGFHEEYEQDGNGVTWSVCFHPNGRYDLFVVFDQPGWEYGGRTHFVGYSREEAAVGALKMMTAGFRCASPQTGLDVEVPPFRTVEELKMKLEVAGHLTSPTRNCTIRDTKQGADT